MTNKARTVGALIVGTGKRRGPGSLKRVKHHMHRDDRADFVVAVQTASRPGPPPPAPPPPPPDPNAAQDDAGDY